MSTTPDNPWGKELDLRCRAKEFAAKLYAAYPYDYHELLFTCDDKELLKEASIQVLITACNGKGWELALAAKNIDEDIDRRLYHLH